MDFSPSIVFGATLRLMWRCMPLSMSIPVRRKWAVSVNLARHWAGLKRMLSARESICFRNPQQPAIGKSVTILPCNLQTPPAWATTETMLSGWLRTEVVWGPFSVLCQWLNYEEPCTIFSTILSAMLNPTSLVVRSGAHPPGLDRRPPATARGTLGFILFGVRRIGIVLHRINLWYFTGASWIPKPEARHIEFGHSTARNLVCSCYLLYLRKPIRRPLFTTRSS